MRTGGLLLLALLPAGLMAQRTRSGNRIDSSEFPKATLDVAPGMVYAGTQRFDLYGVADAEQHFFVELDGTRIKRLLWIQYEGYHPANNSTYNYRDETVEHSGRTWFRSARAVRVPDTEPRPDSDGAHTRAFLRAKGWTMGPDLMLERLVWTLDAPARHELMVIYMEDLAGQGFTAADLNDGGRAHDRWPALAEAFHQRAVAAFSVKDR